MAPDLGYHIHQVGFATFAHTLPGTVLAAVPTGLMFLLIFYLVRPAGLLCLPAAASGGAASVMRAFSARLEALVDHPSLSADWRLDAYLLGRMDS
jgi:hypothetical protein